MNTSRSSLRLSRFVICAGGLALTGLLGAALKDYEPSHPSKPMKSYFAHEVHEDRNGVIAPWYQGLNGQLDERALIAVNVYKRYPWVGKDKAVMAAPDFVYNSHWSISPEGTISIPPTTDWMCGDLSQRAWSIIKGLTAYYQYSGDPIAFLYIPLTVDYILDYAQTDANAPWPSFPISTPTNGKAYGKCDPNARNQLDLCAITGTEVLRAYKLTGNPRYLKAVEHWGDVFADKCNYKDHSLSPWNRYADPSVVGWSDVLTGTTALITDFLDDLINLGYKGKDGLIVKARDRGREFLNTEMLPAWAVNDTWGRTYWDWDNPVMCGTMSMCADHMMKYPKAYPTWKIDLRNMLTTIFNRNGADPNSMGDMYSGAWAFPESSVCCGTSLSYNQYTAGPTLIRYGTLANDLLTKEIGRRMMLMATYDSDENGVVKDGLLGDSVATGEWSNLAHPWPLCQVMEALAWMPKELGANRENHIVRSSSVVSEVEYSVGKISYTTFDARSPAIDVLRLAYVPSAVKADGRELSEDKDSDRNGFLVEPLSNGDTIVTIRHDGARRVEVTGADPWKQVGPEAVQFSGGWQSLKGSSTTAEASASATFSFSGTAVRVLGTVSQKGGWADAYIDGQKQLTVVESWNPAPRHDQPIFIKKGLASGPHELKIVARGAGNTQSLGAEISISGIQTCDAVGDAGFGEGEGPTTAQRMVFGYIGRQDIVDSEGNSWKPATEWVIRSGFSNDTMDKAWWTKRRTMYVGNTKNEELYRYGAHGKEFWANLTVAPGRYDLTLKFADTALTAWMEREKEWQRVTRSVQVFVNGKEVIQPMSISEAAGGLFMAMDRTIKGVEPEHGMIRVHFVGPGDREATVQALELVPAQQ
jgi:Malectin domain